MKKQYLDENGLSLYDALIKEYIGKNNADSSTQILKALEDLANGQVKTNTEAIAILNADAETEGSVANQVNTAVAAVVDSAPEVFDTLKEIADWIADDEQGTAGLIARVSTLEQENKDLKAYVDAQDENYYNSIQAIDAVKIAGLFPVMQPAEMTAADAIAALSEGKALTLQPEQTIAEDIAINKDCFIDANGATFTGVVSIPKDANVVIENAVFVNPVAIV